MPPVPSGTARARDFIGGAMAVSRRRAALKVALAEWDHEIGEAPEQLGAAVGSWLSGGVSLASLLSAIRSAGADDSLEDSESCLEAIKAKFRRVRRAEKFAAVLRDVGAGR